MRDTGHVRQQRKWHSWHSESMFSGFVVSGEWVRPHAPGLLYTSQPLHDGWLLTWWCGWHAVCGNAITMTMTIVHNSEVFKINFCWEISYIIISYNIYIEQKHNWTMLYLCFLRNARCLWPTSGATTSTVARETCRRSERSERNARGRSWSRCMSFWILTSHQPSWIYPLVN